MSVSLSVHRVDHVLVEQHEHEGHHWTKLRMRRRDGSDILAVDVFAATLGHVEIIDVPQPVPTDVG